MLYICIVIIIPVEELQLLSSIQAVELLDGTISGGGSGGGEGHELGKVRVDRGIWELCKDVLEVLRVGLETGAWPGDNCEELVVARV